MTPNKVVIKDLRLSLAGVIVVLRNNDGAGVWPEGGKARINSATFTEGIKKKRQKLNFGRPAQHVA